MKDSEGQAVRHGNPGARGFALTLRQTANYLLVELGGRALALLSIPVFTRILSPEEYGKYNSLLSLSVLAASIFTLDLHRAISRYVYEPDVLDKKEFTGTSIAVAFMLICVFATAAYSLRDSLSGIFKMSSDHWWLIIMAVFVTVPLDVFTYLRQSESRGRSIAVANLTKGYVGFAVGVTLILVKALPGAKAAMLGTVLSGLVVGAFLMVRVRKLIRFSKPRLAHLKYAARYSIPLVPYHLGTAGLGQINKLMVMSMAGGAAAGIYSVSQNLGSLMASVIAALNSAWLPRFFEHMNEGNHEEHDQEVATIMRIIAFFTTTLCLFGPDLCRILVPSEYHYALVAIPVIGSGYMFYALYTAHARQMGYAKKTMLSSIVAIAGFGVNAALNAVLIPSFGYLWAAVSLFISYASLLVFSWVGVSKILHMHTIAFSRCAAAIGITVGAAILSVLCLLLQVNIFLSVSLRIIAALICSAALLMPYRRWITKLLRAKNR